MGDNKKGDKNDIKRKTPADNGPPAKITRPVLSNASIPSGIPITATTPTLNTPMPIILPQGFPLISTPFETLTTPAPLMLTIDQYIALMGPNPFSGYLTTYSGEFQKANLPMIGVSQLMKMINSAPPTSTPSKNFNIDSLLTPSRLPPNPAESNVSSAQNLTIHDALKAITFTPTPVGTPSNSIMTALAPETTAFPNVTSSSPVLPTATASPITFKTLEGMSPEEMVQLALTRAGLAPAPTTMNVSQLTKETPAPVSTSSSLEATLEVGKDTLMPVHLSAVNQTALTDITSNTHKTPTATPAPTDNGIPKPAVSSSQPSSNDLISLINCISAMPTNIHAIPMSNFDFPLGTVTAVPTSVIVSGAKITKSQAEKLTSQPVTTSPTMNAQEQAAAAPTPLIMSPGLDLEYPDIEVISPTQMIDSTATPQRSVVSSPTPTTTFEALNAFLAMPVAPNSKVQETTDKVSANSKLLPPKERVGNIGCSEPPVSSTPPEPTFKVPIGPAPSKNAPKSLPVINSRPITASPPSSEAKSPVTSEISNSTLPTAETSSATTSNTPAQEGARKTFLNMSPLDLLELVNSPNGIPAHFGDPSMDPRMSRSFKYLKQLNERVVRETQRRQEEQSIDQVLEEMSMVSWPLQSLRLR